MLLGSVYGQVTNDTLPVQDDDEVDSIAMAESVITIIGRVFEILMLQRLD